MKLRIVTAGVELAPIPAQNAVANSLYLDNVSNTVSIKDNNSVTGTVSSSSSDPSKKVMQSGQATPITKYTPLGKLSNGKVVAAGSDTVNGQEVVAVALEDFAGLDSIGLVQCVGQNVPGMLTGLGFVPGDEIFLNEGGGYTKDTSLFTGMNDSIIKIGVADCASGQASATVTDLILFPEVIARP